MKKLIFASGLLALMAAATSCEKYDIYPEQFDSVFTIKDSGTKDLVLYATDEVKEYPVIIMKGGYDPEVKSTATLKVLNDREFADYNESLGGMPYILVGSECYSFSPVAGEEMTARTFDFASADKKAETVNLYLRPGKIKTWVEANADEIANGKLSPVIPIKLESETDTVNAYGNITLLKVDVRTPQFTVDVPTITSRVANKQTFSTDAPNDYKPEAHFRLECQNPWGFKLKLITDPDIIEDYNDENGTSFIPMKADQFDLVPEIYFAPGVDYMPLDLTIHLDNIPVGKRQYAVAVAFDDPAMVWDNENYNPGEGAIDFDKERIMIFTVRVNNNVVLEKVALSAANVSGNDIETTEGSIAGLFDGDTSTYCHSAWTVANPREATFASYLEMTLPSEMSAFRFNVTNRNSAAAAGYMKTVHLYGSNDKTNWTKFAEITNMNASGLLDGAAKSASFGSDEEPFTDGNSYKYLRFCIMESGGGSLGTSSASIFWHASELELYGN